MSKNSTRDSNQTHSHNASGKTSIVASLVATTALVALSPMSVYGAVGVVNKQQQSSNPGLDKGPHAFADKMQKMMDARAKAGASAVSDSKIQRAIDLAKKAETSNFMVPISRKAQKFHEEVNSNHLKINLSSQMERQVMVNYMLAGADANIIAKYGSKIEVIGNKDQTWLANMHNMKSMAQLAGTLTANIPVVLSNPAGFWLKSTGVVDVAKLTILTGQKSENMFGSQFYNFSNKNAPILIEGQIRISGETVHEKGLGVFLGASGGVVLGKGSVILAGLKRVTLASGLSSAVVDFANDGLVSFAASDRDLEKSLELTGQIFGDKTFDGSVVLMSSDEALQTVRGVMSTSVGATKARVEAGEIVLSSNAATVVSGDLRAVQGENGGRVKVAGHVVNMAHAKIDASGLVKGGYVVIGGDFQGLNKTTKEFEITHKSIDTAGLEAQDGFTISHAETAQHVVVSERATISVSGSAEGGVVKVWAGADGETQASLTVRGTIDLSSSHGVAGRADASVQKKGKLHLHTKKDQDLGRGFKIDGPSGDGRVLFDPAHIVFSTAAVINGQIEGANPNVGGGADLLVNAPWLAPGNNVDLNTGFVVTAAGGVQDLSVGENGRGRGHVIADNEISVIDAATVLAGYQFATDGWIVVASAISAAAGASATVNFSAIQGIELRANVGNARGGAAAGVVLTSAAGPIQVFPGSNAQVLINGQNQSLISLSAGTFIGTNAEPLVVNTGIDHTNRPRVQATSTGNGNIYLKGMNNAAVGNLLIEGVTTGGAVVLEGLDILNSMGAALTANSLQNLTGLTLLYNGAKTVDQALVTTTLAAVAAPDALTSIGFGVVGANLTVNGNVNFGARALTLRGDDIISNAAASLNADVLRGDLTGLTLQYNDAKEIAGNMFLAVQNGANTAITIQTLGALDLTVPGANVNFGDRNVSLNSGRAILRTDANSRITTTGSLSLNAAGAIAEVANPLSVAVGAGGLTITTTAAGAVGITSAAELTLGAVTVNNGATSIATTAVGGITLTDDVGTTGGGANGAFTLNSFAGITQEANKTITTGVGVITLTAAVGSDIGSQASPILVDTTGALTVTQGKNLWLNFKVPAAHGTHRSLGIITVDQSINIKTTGDHGAETNLTTTAAITSANGSVNIATSRGKITLGGVVSAANGDVSLEAQSGDLDFGNDALFTITARDGGSVFLEGNDLDRWVVSQIRGQIKTLSMLYHQTKTLVQAPAAGTVDVAGVMDFVHDKTQFDTLTFGGTVGNSVIIGQNLDLTAMHGGANDGTLILRGDQILGVDRTALKTAAALIGDVGSVNDVIAAILGWVEALALPALTADANPNTAPAAKAAIAALADRGSFLNSGTNFGHTFNNLAALHLQYNDNPAPVVAGSAATAGNAANLLLSKIAASFHVGAPNAKIKVENLGGTLETIGGINLENGGNYNFGGGDVAGLNIDRELTLISQGGKGEIIVGANGGFAAISKVTLEARKVSGDFKARTGNVIAIINNKVDSKLELNSSINFDGNGLLNLGSYGVDAGAGIGQAADKFINFITAAGRLSITVPVANASVALSVKNTQAVGNPVKLETIGTVGGAVSLTATAGSGSGFELTDTVDLTNAQPGANFTLTADGNGAIIKSNAGAITTGTGNITLTAAGTGAVGGAGLNGAIPVTTTGHVAASTGMGGVYLTSATATTFGAITTGGLFSFAETAGVLSTLTLTQNIEAPGGVTIAFANVGVVALGGRTISTKGADDVNGGNISITTTAGNLVVQNGTLDSSGGANAVAGGRNAGTVTLQAFDALFLNGGDLIINAKGSAGAAGNAGGTGGNVSLISGNANGVTFASNVSVDSSGGAHGDGGLNPPGQAGDFTFTSLGAVVDGQHLTITKAHNYTLTAAGAATLGAITSTGMASANTSAANANITLNALVTAAGGLTLNAGTGHILHANAGAVHGDITITNAENVTLYTANNTALTFTNAITGDLQFNLTAVDATQTITLATGITAAGHDVTFTLANGGMVALGGNTIRTAGAVGAGGAIRILSTAGHLTLSNGNLTSTGFDGFGGGLIAVTAGNGGVLTVGNGTFTSNGGAHGGGADDHGQAAGTVTLAGATGLEINGGLLTIHAKGSDANGVGNAGAGGDVTLSSVANNVTFTAALTIDSSKGDVGGGVAMAGAIGATAAGAVALNANLTTTGGALALTATANDIALGANINTNTQALTLVATAGAITRTAGTLTTDAGVISLSAHADHDIGAMGVAIAVSTTSPLVVPQGQSLWLTSAGPLSLGAIATANGVDIIGQSVSALQITANAGDIKISSTGGLVTIAAAVHAVAGSVTLTSVGAFDLTIGASVRASGNVTVTSEQNIVGAVGGFAGRVTSDGGNVHLEAAAIDFGLFNDDAIVTSNGAGNGGAVTLKTDLLTWKAATAIDTSSGGANGNGGALTLQGLTGTSMKIDGLAGAFTYTNTEHGTGAAGILTVDGRDGEVKFVLNAIADSAVYTAAGNVFQNISALDLSANDAAGFTVQQAAGAGVVSLDTVGGLFGRAVDTAINPVVDALGYAREHGEFVAAEAQRGKLKSIAIRTTAGDLALDNGGGNINFGSRKVTLEGGDIIGINNVGVISGGVIDLTMLYHGAKNLQQAAGDINFNMIIGAVDGAAATLKAIGIGITTADELTFGGLVDFGDRDVTLISGAALDVDEDITLLATRKLTLQSETAMTITDAIVAPGGFKASTNNGAITINQTVTADAGDVNISATGGALTLSQAVEASGKITLASVGAFDVTIGAVVTAPSGVVVTSEQHIVGANNAGSFVTTDADISLRATGNVVLTQFANAGNGFQTTGLVSLQGLGITFKNAVLNQTVTGLSLLFGAAKTLQQNVANVRLDRIAALWSGNADNATSLTIGTTAGELTLGTALNLATIGMGAINLTLNSAEALNVANAISSLSNLTLASGTGAFDVTIGAAVTAPGGVVVTSGRNIVGANNAGSFVTTDADISLTAAGNVDLTNFAVGGAGFQTTGLVSLQGADILGLNTANVLHANVTKLSLLFGGDRVLQATAANVQLDHIAALANGGNYGAITDLTIGTTSGNLTVLQAVLDATNNFVDKNITLRGNDIVFKNNANAVDAAAATVTTTGITTLQYNDAKDLNTALFTKYKTVLGGVGAVAIETMAGNLTLVEAVDLSGGLAEMERDIYLYAANNIVNGGDFTLKMKNKFLVLWAQGGDIASDGAVFKVDNADKVRVKAPSGKAYVQGGATSGLKLDLVATNDETKLSSLAGITQVATKTINTGAGVLTLSAAVGSDIGAVGAGSIVIANSGALTVTNGRDVYLRSSAATIEVASITSANSVTLKARNVTKGAGVITTPTLNLLADDGAGNLAALTIANAGGFITAAHLLALVNAGANNSTVRNLRLYGDSIDVQQVVDFSTITDQVSVTKLNTVTLESDSGDIETSVALGVVNVGNGTLVLTSGNEIGVTGGRYFKFETGVTGKIQATSVRRMFLISGAAARISTIDAAGILGIETTVGALEFLDDVSGDIVTIGSAGAITQIAGKTLTSTGGDVSLTAAVGNIGSGADKIKVSVTGGDLVVDSAGEACITSAVALTLGAIATHGHLSIAALSIAGAAGAAGQITTGGGNVLLVANTHIDFTEFNGAAITTGGGTLGLVSKTGGTFTFAGKNFNTSTAVPDANGGGVALVAMNGNLILAGEGIFDLNKDGTGEKGSLVLVAADVLNAGVGAGHIVSVLGKITAAHTKGIGFAAKRNVGASGTPILFGADVPIHTFNTEIASYVVGDLAIPAVTILQAQLTALNGGAGHPVNINNVGGEFVVETDATDLITQNIKAVGDMELKSFANLTQTAGSTVSTGAGAIALTANGAIQSSDFALVPALGAFKVTSTGVISVASTAAGDVNVENTAGDTTFGAITTQDATTLTSALGDMEFTQNVTTNGGALHVHIKKNADKAIRFNKAGLANVTINTANGSITFSESNNGGLYISGLVEFNTGMLADPVKVNTTSSSVIMKTGFKATFSVGATAIEYDLNGVNTATRSETAGAYEVVGADDVVIHYVAPVGGGSWSPPPPVEPVVEPEVPPVPGDSGSGAPGSGSTPLTPEEIKKQIEKLSDDINKTLNSSDSSSVIHGLVERAETLLSMVQNLSQGPKGPTGPSGFLSTSDLIGILANGGSGSSAGGSSASPQGDTGSSPVILSASEGPSSSGTPAGGVSGSALNMTQGETSPSVVVGLGGKQTITVLGNIGLSLPPSLSEQARSARMQGDMIYVGSSVNNWSNPFSVPVSTTPTQISVVPMVVPSLQVVDGALQIVNTTVGGSRSSIVQSGSFDVTSAMLQPQVVTTQSPMGAPVVIFVGKGSATPVTLTSSPTSAVVILSPEEQERLRKAAAAKAAAGTGGTAQAAAAAGSTGGTSVVSERLSVISGAVMIPGNTVGYTSAPVQASVMVPASKPIVIPSSPRAVVQAGIPATRIGGSDTTSVVIPASAAAPIASAQTSSIISGAATGGFTGGTGVFSIGGRGGFAPSSNAGNGGYAPAGSGDVVIPGSASAPAGNVGSGGALPRTVEIPGDSR